jgi:hypothetical protein
VALIRPFLPVNQPLATSSSTGPRGAVFVSMALFRSLTFEQNENKDRTIKGQEEVMIDMVQDVVSLVSMSAFLMAMAMLIGAM